MIRVDQSGERGFGGVIPFTGCGFASSVLSGGNDFKVFAFEFFVQFLPDRQIQPAASPRGPRHDEHLPAAKGAKAHHVSLAVGCCKIGRSARIQETAAKHWNLSKAPDQRFRVDNHGLSYLSGERCEVEVLAAHHVFGNGNADVGATCALRLQFERIDARQIHFPDPKRVFGFARIRQYLIKRDGVIVEQNGCRSATLRCRKFPGEGGSRAGYSKKVSSVHDDTFPSPGPRQPAALAQCAFS